MNKRTRSKHLAGATLALSMYMSRHRGLDNYPMTPQQFATWCGMMHAAGREAPLC